MNKGNTYPKPPDKWHFFRATRVWAGYYLATGQVSLPSGAVINTPIYTVLPNNATVVSTKIDYLTVSPDQLLNLMRQLDKDLDLYRRIVGFRNVVV
ncbi:MAG: hypothetical protein JHC26_13105, partial [Thermofilum sp.]|uniref:hypothetical protein n=1 Tax=Thermofilum sp. TaxID=1961369 RepID=UPI00258D511A